MIKVRLFVAAFLALLLTALASRAQDVKTENIPNDLLAQVERSQFALVLLPVTHAQPEDRNSMKPLEVTLRDEASDLTKVDRSLLKIQVSLLIEQNQPDVSKGLRGAAVFRNRGSETVSLLDLQDITIFAVLDSSGRRVRVPEKVPDIYVNRRDPTTASPIKIEPGEEYRLSLEVARMHPYELESSKGSSSAANNSDANLIPIPPGHYKVRLRTALIGKSMAASRFLNSEYVDVILGQVSEHE